MTEQDEPTGQDRPTGEEEPTGQDGPTGEERQARRSQARPLIIGGAVALVLVVAAVAFHEHSDSVNSRLPAGTNAPLPGATNSSFDTQGVQTLELDGFNGKLTIGVGGPGHVTVAASDGAPNADGPFFRLNAAAGTLVLACGNQHPALGTPAPAPAACPAGDYDISVPAGLGVKLDELSGQANLVGLSGPVSITATSADTTAVGLRTTDFTAAVTSGTLDASFAAAPRHLAVSVTSAHATVRLPGTVGYNIAQQAVSADIQVGVPESDTSPYDVQAVATSGEISLVTA